MNELRPTLKPDHFDALYAADPDPWNFAASPYERAKYIRSHLMHTKTAFPIGARGGMFNRRADASARAARCHSLPRDRRRSGSPRPSARPVSGSGFAPKQERVSAIATPQSFVDRIKGALVRMCHASVSLALRSRSASSRALHGRQ